MNQETITTMAPRDFKKLEYNPDFDHSAAVVKMMNEMGYSNVKVTTSLTNGLSHYVNLTVDVLDWGKCYAEMFIWEGTTSITIRISDHASGLERNCGGVCGNQMTMYAFRELIASGAIRGNN